MVKTIIKRRQIAPNHPSYAHIDAFLHPYLASRGAGAGEDFSFSLGSLPDWRSLKNIQAAVELLHQALQQQQRIVIVGDYDADGATSVALMHQALREFGAGNISWYVPDRFKLGYGLSPELVAALQPEQPQLLITVDNGVAAIAGARAALELGCKLLITDHHLPGSELPQCSALINPNLRDCRFPGKNLAGVGVAFYLLLALRSYLIEQQYFLFRGVQPPKLAQYLDLVALGTIADLVKLDSINRTLVEQGLRRIRAGRCSPGVRALFAISKRVVKRATSSDLSFALAPRLNAAGRIEDMSLGIKCLLSSDYRQALALATELDKLNNKRKTIELSMYNKAQEQIEQDLQQLLEADSASANAICLYSDKFHEGVVGIIAGRLKDSTGKPTVIFARGQDGLLKGSARSVAAVHMRDLLETIDNANPGLIVRFGGHAMAAGLTISADNLPAFAPIFTRQVQAAFGSSEPARVFISDGELSSSALCAANAEAIRYACPWGCGFDEPLFEGQFQVLQQRLIKDRHLFLTLLSGERSLEAVLFNSGKDYYPIANPRAAKIIYNLDLNLYRGAYNLRLNIRHILQEHDHVEHS